jgi:DNA-binding MarR family transcriptional regulator
VQLQPLYENISPESELSPLVEQPHLDAWRALLNAHAGMTRQIEEALSKADLPPLGWYDVLWPVYQAKGRRMRMRDLSEKVVTISRSGLTRLVDRVVDAGMLTREPTPNDRRGTDVVLTDEGTKLLKRMWPIYAEVVNAYFVKPLPKSRAEDLRDSLRRVG